MKGNVGNVVMLVGNKNKDEVFGIGQLERALSIGIAQRMRPFHYDEVCRIDGVSRVKPVRLDNGKLDVLSTFMRVRNIRKTNGGIL